MNEIKVFNYEENEVRTVEKDGEVWWVLADVCKILDISKYRDAAERLNNDEREPVKVDTLGGKQEMICINESGLYNLIFRSNKPEAESFRRWVTHEVLPSIRKTGSFGIPNMRFMQDKRLTLQAKAIFMYLLNCSDGKNPFSVPPCSDITNALGIGTDQYRRHFNILKQYGYIQSQRTRRLDGKLGRTMITINNTPAITDNSPLGNL